MANTTRFMIEIPDVGADADMWGTILNNYFNALEPKIFDRSAGDTVSGPLTVTGLTSVDALTATGVVTGNGSGLTNLNAANIATGIIGNARTTATFNATANTIVLRGAQGGFSANLVNVTGLTSTGTVNTPTVNGATTLALQTAGVDRVTLTQGGNLLVGTTSDRGYRTVSESASPEGFAVVRNVNTAVSGDAGSFIDIGALNGTTFSPGARITGVTSTTSGFLTFSTRLADSLAERARITGGGNFRPGADNAYSLGEPSFRWSVVYAATGTINTSDERAKLDFAPTLGLDFIAALEPVSYRYKNGKTVIDQVEDGTEEVPAVLDEDGNEVTPATTKPKYKFVERVAEGTRRHHGLKAQQVKSVLDTFGADFAGWVLENPDDPNSGQGLRYDQFIAPLIKAVQELSAQNAALTDRIAALEAK